MSPLQTTGGKDEHKQRKSDMSPLQTTGGKDEHRFLCGNRNGYHHPELRT